MADPNEEEPVAGAPQEPSQREGSEDSGAALEDSFADLISAGLRAESMLATPDEEAPDEEPEEEQDDEAEEEEGEEPAAEAEKPTPPAQNEWVTTLRTAPQRINEIPAKERGAAVQQLINAERQAAAEAINKAQADTRAQVETEVKVKAAVEGIDQLKAEDPEAFAEWTEADPKAAAAYFAYKQNGLAPAQADTKQVIADAAKPLLDQVKAYPDAYAEIVAKDTADQARYAPTPQGLSRLAADVAEAIAKATAAPSNAQQALDKRREAQAARKAIPRPDVSTGRKAESVLSNDPEELIAAGWAEARKSTPR